jgi:hypothetical protein
MPILPSPELDGKTHINVYSRGLTKLGRDLSNFAAIPFTLPDHGAFQSVEAYWYWLSCKNDRLRKLSGYEAKKQGRALRGEDWPTDSEFKTNIRRAILAKIMQNPKLAKALKASELILTHYYVDSNQRPIVIKEADWILEFIEDIRIELKSLSI